MVFHFYFSLLWHWLITRDNGLLWLDRYFQGYQILHWWLDFHWKSFLLFCLIGLNSWSTLSLWVITSRTMLGILDTSHVKRSCLSLKNLRRFLFVLAQSLVPIWTVCLSLDSFRAFFSIVSLFSSLSSTFRMPNFCNCFTGVSFHGWAKTRMSIDLVAPNFHNFLAYREFDHLVIRKGNNFHLV